MNDDYADNYFDLYYALKNLFGRDIDLVDENSVKNPYFKEELEETKYLICEGAEEVVAISVETLLQCGNFASLHRRLSERG